MLAKHLTNRSFDAISLHSTRQGSFGCNYSKPGVLLAIAHEEYLEVFVRNTFSMDGMVETIFAQQTMRSSKFSRNSDTRPRVSHGLWRGEP